MKRIVSILIFLLCLGSIVKAQTVTVTSPNGGEVWAACATKSITWAGSSTSGYYNVDYSTNGGATWASIATFLNATSVNWVVPNVQSTTCLIRVYDSYNSSISDQSNAAFTINAAVRVTSPNGGESWQVGSPATRTITWIPSGTGTYVTIEYSIDAGSNWSTITSSALASSGSYNWTLPNTPSTQCLVRVKDNNTPCMSDVSDALFTIVAPVPTLTVTSPNTAVTWYVGYTNNIQWSTQYVSSPFVAIDYSTDGGSTWTVVTTSTNNSGTYNWTIPNTPSNQCRVRVKDASNPAVFDISNVDFTIALPVWTITVTSPNGGQTWNSCSAYNITWSNTFVTGSYKIEYSSDNGASWNTIVASVSGSSYNWTVPNNIATSSQCLIRVSSVTNPSVFDVSNANFTINQFQYIIVTSPNGNENWQVGNPSTRQITWVYNSTNTVFKLEYSTDNGATWSVINSSYSAGSSPATYNWTLPNIPSSQYLVRVSDYYNTCRSDVSDNMFTITAPTPAITVTNPNNAVTWYVGSSYSINWTSQYVTHPYVNIDYTYDGGATWNTIIATTNNNGSYSWTVPNTPSTQCKIRIRDASNPATMDTSNVNFTIATPVSSISVTSPNGGETWSSCSNYNITWAQSNVTGPYKIEYSDNGGSTWNTIINSTNGSSYNWQVPNSIPTSSQCLIRVSSVNNPAVTDISNAAFTINQVQFIVVTSPNGGENWQVGNPATQQITWVYNGTNNSFKIEYSIDNGATWSVINSNYYDAASPASYNWTVPNTPSNQCLVRVSDYYNTCRMDVSDSTFEIQSPTPTITVTSPNTAVTWYVGNSHSINWNTSYVTDPFVAIDYSTDGGASWTNIVSAINASLNTYSWTVPNTPSSQARIRVRSSVNPGIMDTSNVDFTIATPVSTISVNSPDGGESWNSCTNYNITWSNTFVTGSYRLEYSQDNGLTWNLIVAGTTGSSYNWLVPGNVITSNQCLVKVTSNTNPSVFDVSTANFTLNHIPYIVVTSPNGGETWQVANPANQQISWVYTGTNNNFKVEYSTDNGATWSVIVNNHYDAASPASVNWTIPNTPSTQCLVRVSDYYNSCRADESDAVFEIQAPTPTITVSQPNTALTWYVGYSYTISWNSAYVNDPYVAIDYSVDGGSTWTNIVASTNTTLGSYSWTVPNTPTSQARVRVRSTATPTIFDISNVDFTIATPVPSITVNSPNGGETLSSCNNHTVNWTSAFLTGAYKLEYSSDNGLTWNTIVNSTTGSSYVWQVPNNIQTSSQCRVKVTSVSNPTVFDSSDATFTINYIPYIAITSPAGGETWQIGNPANRQITWVYSGTNNNFKIEYSTNNGVSWNTIENNYYDAASPASYNWTVPNTPSAQCLVRVTDYYNTCRTDLSDSTFEIQAPTPTITVTSPNTAVTWYIGYSNTISWNSAYVTDPFVAIDYSIDGGNTFTNIVSSVNTTTGSYSWNIPNTPSTQARVRVRSTVNPSIADTSNVDFTIAPPVPSITVNTPNGGENLSSCVSHNINWSPAFLTGSYKLEYSIDSGATWNLIVASTTGSNYNWQVPNSITTSNQSLIKVSSNSNPSVFDISDAVFTITQIPYIVVNSPAGNEIWQVGNPSVRPISWVYSGTTNNFRIEYSTDNGSSWTTINSNYSASSSPATFNWTVPNTPSTQCLVRVTDYYNTCKTDQSDTTFTILAPSPAITVTSPNTAVTWGVGGNYNITWSSQYVTAPFVAIDYSIDGGATWTNIVGAINTSLGSYNWTVPNTVSNQCRVRVRDNTNPTVFDISNVNFSIVPPITLTSPNGGENWGGCTISSVTWSAYGTSGNYRIEYSTDNGQTWTIMNSSYSVSGSNCSFSWTMPHVSSSNCLVRVSDASALSKTDVSNFPFTIFPAIVVTNPNTNIAAFAGQTLNITWTSNGVSNYYNIDYSINGGSTWTNVVFNTLIGTNSYSWTVPSTVSSNCLVRVTDYQNTCKQDVSDAVFSIANSTANIVITTPNGGESWGACDSSLIQWSAQTTSGTYNLEYSVNGGSSWLPIASNYAIAGANCSYMWAVPNTLSGNCLVRVTDASNAAKTDLSDAVFTIVPFSFTASASPGTVCAGSPATLTATGATAYTWQPGNLSGSSVIVNPLSSTTYTVSGTKGGCTASTAVPVAVIALPVVNASVSPTSICPGDNATLSATGATSYTWSPASSLNVSNGASPTASPTATTIYTVTGTSNGCADTATVTVNVTSSQSLNVTASNDTICVGSSTTLTASGAANYTWQPGNLSGNSIVVSPTLTTTYTVTGNTGSCSGTTTFTVVVAPVPSVIATPSQAAICSGDSVALSASGASAYLWQPGNLTGASVTVTPASTTTYVVSGSNGGCTSTDTILVTVNPSPTLSISGNTNICAGGNTTLTASGASTYVWMPGNLTGASISIAPGSTTNYTVSGTSAGCTSNESVSVTVHALPAVTANASQTVVCSGQSVTLSAAGASSYTWMPGNLTGLAVNVNPTVTTTYTVTGTNGFCTDTALVTVTVQPAPALSINGTTVICKGDSTLLTAAGASSYSWQPGGSTNTSIVVSPTVTTTYLLTGSNGTCQDTTSVTVTVQPLPVLNVNGPTTICSGTSTTLTASGASSYIWQPGNFPGSVFTAAPTGTTTYSVTGTNGNCNATQNITVTVVPSPNITASASQDTICVGTATTLTASGAASYNWMPGNLNGSSVSVMPTVTTTYLVTGINGTCSDTQSVTIVVNSMIPLSASGGGTICAGNSATLTASGATSYSWQPGNLTGSTIVVTPTATTTYTVTGNSGGCSGTQSVTVTVNPVPVTLVSGNSTICSGTSTQLTASGASTYNWQPGNMSSSSVVVSPTLTTTYSVIGTSNGCSDTATFTVTVNSIPAVTATGTDTICSGTSVQLAASGAVMYNWQPGNMSGSSVNVTPTATTTYLVAGTDGNGCTGYAGVTITVDQTPLVTAAGGGTICSGDSITLSASGGVSYSWMPGSYSGSPVVISPTTSATYVVTATGSNGCTAKDSVHVNVIASPSVSAAALQSAICQGGSTTLTASGASSLVWQPGNVSGNTMVVAPTTTTTYTVTGTSASGCTDSATVTVTVNPNPMVTVTGGGTMCAGGNASLMAAGAVAYNWQPGNLSGSTLSVSPATSTTYTVTGYSAAGCASTASAMVTVTSAPIVVASGNTSICSGSATTLTASGASGYVWQPGNLTGSSVAVSPTATTAYVVTGQDTNGCSATDTIIVTVQTAPNVFATAVQDTICNGTSTMLSASGAGSYTWQPGNLTGNAISVSPSVTTTYTLTGLNGTCSGTAQVLVTVTAGPPVAIAASNTTLCSGDSATLTASGATNYSWTPGGQNSGSITVSPSSTTTYIVTGTDNTGCTSTATSTISVDQTPQVIANASKSTICAGEAVTLNAAGAALYNWQPSNTGGASVTVSPTLTTTYTVTGTTPGGCSDTSSVVIVVNPLPVVAFVIPDSTVCQNHAPFILTGGSPSGGTYAGQGVVSGMFDPMSAGLGLHLVSYSFTDQGTGCSASVSDEIDVDACTGVKESQAGAFSVYPNPTQNQLTLEMKGFTTEMKVEIYNMLGERIGQLTMDKATMQVDLASHPPGVYHVIVYSPDGVIKKKVVKL